MLTKQDLIDFTEEITKLYDDGLIHSPIHLSRGNEDKLIKIFREIRHDDWVFSTYRSHYHALLKGIPREWLKNQILNGHSMHINSKEHKFFTSSIVGGICPIATGVAMALSKRNTTSMVWCFVGDMAAEMGIFHESLKYSRRNTLPIKFIIEDNGLGVNTPTNFAWGIGYDYESTYEESYKYKRVTPHAGTGKWIKF